MHREKFMSSTVAHHKHILAVYYYLVVYKRIEILYQIQSNVVIDFTVAFRPEKKSQMERMIKMNW